MKSKYFTLPTIGGLLIIAACAAVILYLSQIVWFQQHGLSALTLAIIIGLLVGNTIPQYLLTRISSGIEIAKKQILRLGIILYGFNLTFENLLELGIKGIIIDVLMIATTFILCYWLGTKIFKLDSPTTILIGAGCSICGAAAVLGTAPIAKGKNDDVTIAIAVVVVFGTLAMFLYPFIYQFCLAGQLPYLSPHEFGIYTGASIHEVAQVVAAGKAMGNDVAGMAIIAKLTRVLLLAPFLIVLSLFLVYRDKSSTQKQKIDLKSTIPWFALGFVLVAIINSLNILPANIIQYTLKFDTLLLTMAMFALGLTTHRNALQKAGVKPLILGLVLFGWLIIGGYLFTLII
ncbi:YeiH family protein [Zophobihabitans entericus]|uniref:YeiH family putative sulfate export transporter n=1 Tax=Zophobihabitans entericus TaxID=1635327 RepID=A0A6G9IAV9_9GAMM|nr:YeiH family protein [Zophobihabitans entericus]QIQ21361.1 YeiH family putative sulfate export transporter [Zophobihabitans entericus]